ncbi:phage major capsid protein [Listeria seeligeri]|uniref:phage major capsid protein n=1 Tax=Listeria seeligeri TaxID=1640 RepID=UPI001887263B|nr:phage major capsid protein [Listeria seeligeri]MBF2653958.1 phage major capsid protein [Listeria seeligeri]
MTTLFELKDNIATVAEQLVKVENDLAQKAMDTKVSVEDLQNLQKTADTLKERMDILQKRHDAMQAERKEKLEKQNGEGFGESDTKQSQIINAKAQLIRATMNKSSVPDKAQETLSQQYKNNVFAALIDNTTTGGADFIPKNTATNVLSEPLAQNPLRSASTYTTIPNLEVPKVSFSLDDDDFIQDGATAKEMKATGSIVAFTRNKYKVFTDISETVINGTNTDLVSTVEANLQNGVAVKEKNVAFAATPKAGQEHMSFYDTTEVKIKHVTGPTMFEAVINAAADLEDSYGANAKVFMRKVDYLNMVKDLSNSSSTLYGRPPEEVIGYPVEFCDKATSPVVGDFSYSHFNYDIQALYETDKNIKTGMQSFVVTAWFDHRIKLSSAFRIVDIATTP